MVLMLVVFVVLFVVAIGAAIFLFGDPESAFVPALILSGLGTGVITVGLSDADRTLIVVLVIVLAAAILLGAYMIARSRRR